MMRLFSKRANTALDEANRRLAASVTVDDVVVALTALARASLGADGVTLVERIGDDVAYVSEDAISPLWRGSRFPMRGCVSGMALLAGAPIVMADIRQDPRVPLHLYLSTFVRSMVMTPLDTRYAMGVYWREAQPVPPTMLERIADIAAAAGAALARIGSAGPLRSVA